MKTFKVKVVLIVSLLVFTIFTSSIALGYFVSIMIRIPFSFGFIPLVRMIGVIILVSGFTLLGWLFKLRKPIDILTSTYITLTKMIVRVGLENTKIRTEPLVIQGPYKHVRHPLYLAVVTLMVGWWLLLDYSFLIFSAIFLLLWFNFVVIPLEEKELKAIFGEEYERYSNEVPKIIPFTKRKNT